MDKEILIEKYIHQELTESEYKILLQTARENFSFKEELELRIAMHADFKTDMKKSMLQSLKTPTESIPKSSQSKKYSFKRYLILIFGLLLTGYVLSTLFQRTTYTKEIYASYLEEPVPQPTITKNEQFSAQDPWHVAKQEYANGNFQEFLENIQGIEINEEQRFFKALALLYGKPPMFIQSISEFETILQNEPTGIFAEESQWYLAIAYMATEDYEKSEVILNYIISVKGWNHEKARTLLTKHKQQNQ